MTCGRRRFLAAVGLATLAGCAGGGGPAATTTSDAGRDGTASPTETAAVPTVDEPLPLPMSPESLRDEAMSGGPPKDGIPSIDDPRFADPDAVDFLEPGDPVFGVAREGTAKAYPQRILVRHEIVNDELAGTPVSVTYCPLTGTVLGFERGDTTFGVSGRLINDNLVMYDRATETWWPQILGTSIPGPWHADPEIRSLREFRLIWTSWERWTAAYPDTRVLTTTTGSAFNYGRDPYGAYNPPRGYYVNDRLLFPALDWDDRFESKTVVMGARTPRGAVAFPKAAIREHRILTGELGDQPVLAVYDDRFDTAYVYRNPDESSFEYNEGEVSGPEGGSHPPSALPLGRVHTFDAMWFAWSGYYPDTSVHG